MATIYSYEVDALVKSQIPKSIRDAMEQKGWNAFGIYELVSTELRLERKRLKKLGTSSKGSDTNV